MRFYPFQSKLRRELEAQVLTSIYKIRLLGLKALVARDDV